MARRRVGHRINGRGTLRVDRRFKGIGRIAKASGTNDPKAYAGILTMLGQLHSQGRFRVLEEIRDGVVSPLEVYTKWTAGELDHLQSAATLRLVDPVVVDWIAASELKAVTKKNYLSEVQRFVARVGNVRIQDIPEGLERYRVLCRSRGIEPTFNKARKALLSYASKMLPGKKADPLRNRIAGVPVLKETSKPKARQFSVKEMADILKRLPKPHRDIARTMLFTGMGWTELIGEWEALHDRVTIRGTKTKGRVRVIPRFEEKLTRPERGKDSFKTALKKAEATCTPLSFRRTFALWMSEAGISRIRRKSYLGHGDSDMTDRYERGEVDRFLREDAFALSAYTAEEMSKVEKSDDYQPPSHVYMHWRAPRV